MDTKELIKGISADQWTKAASLARLTPEQLQSQYEALLADHPTNLRHIEVTRGAVIQSGDCVKQGFEISLFKIVGLKGNVEFCGPSSDWSAKYHICLELAGNSVWCTDYTLSPSNTSICYSVDLALVAAQFCVGIVGSNHCFNVNGKAGYWAFGWHWGDFNENVVCFG